MTTLPRLAGTLGLLLAATAALANPTVSPGLWEYRTSMVPSDPGMQQAMEKAQKALAGMSPEQRKMMEQMMASQGMSIGAVGGAGAGGGTAITVKVCITPEQAAKQELPPSDARCTHRITGRTARSMKFAVECPAEQARGEGEMTFSSPKAYDGRFSMQQTREGQPLRMDSTIAARWLSADCGAVKPVN